MASNDSIFQQINRPDIDVQILLRARTAVDQRLTAKRRDLEQQLAAVRDAFGAEPPKRLGRPRASTTLVQHRRTRPRAASAGKHDGMSVAEAVRKMITSKGGKLPASEIKKAFDTAGDRRNLNFSLLVQSGAIKRNGFEQRKGKGRAGGIYSAA